MEKNRRRNVKFATNCRGNRHQNRCRGRRITTKSIWKMVPKSMRRFQICYKIHMKSTPTSDVEVADLRKSPFENLPKSINIDYDFHMMEMIMIMNGDHVPDDHKNKFQKIFFESILWWSEIFTMRCHHHDCDHDHHEFRQTVSSQVIKMSWVRSVLIIFMMIFMIMMYWVLIIVIMDHQCRVTCAI